jgi:hypothetical protein
MSLGGTGSVRMLVSALVLAAALGGGGSARAAQAQDRACGLLTPDEVRAATGLAVEAAKAVTTPQGDPACAFRGPGRAELGVVLHEPGGKALFESTRARLGPAVVGVGGLGDDAYARETGPVQAVTVLKGDSAVSVSFLLGAPGSLPKLEELARKALTRL